MGAWKNEDEIKAELRLLTQELRQLREELRSMVTPKPNPTRKLLHRQAWPPTAADEPVAQAADSSQRRPRKRETK